MGWRHRYIKSKSVYEICFRARSGIPLPCSDEVNFLVECALAWALRGKKLKILHLVVMGNHVHMMVLVYDAEEFIQFYGELMKRLTDSIKRLTGRRHLRIWESRAMVALIADADMCIERIKYFYLNPARANLIRSIKEYPGISSWKAFTNTNLNEKEFTSQEVPHIYMPDIVCNSKRLIETLKIKAKNRPNFALTYYPFAWMEVFDVSKSSTEIRNEIIDEIYNEEKTLESERIKNGTSVINLYKLRTQPPLAPFIPKKYGRKIFVLSSIKEVRKTLIQHIMHLCEKCAGLYVKWKCGEYPIDWPLGMFRPRAPNLISLISN